VWGRLCYGQTDKERDGDGPMGVGGLYRYDVREGLVLMSEREGGVSHSAILNV